MLLRRSVLMWLAIAALALCASIAHAHEFKLDARLNAFVKIDGDDAHLVIRAPLYLFKSVRFPSKGIEVDVDNAGPALQRSLDAIRSDVRLFEDGRELVPSSADARLSLPSDRSFVSYEQAVAHVARAPDRGEGIVIDQGYVDAHFVYRISSPASAFSLRTTAAPELGDYLKVALRYLPASGEGRSMVITSRLGDVDLNPSAWRASATFVSLGIFHILTGFDHLLFLLALMIPLRGWRPILAVVTVFTVAHSLTLLGSAFGLIPSGAWFPAIVETAIAVSVLFMAIENVIGVDVSRRVLITGLFGLVHGFGFSYGLKENFQFAGDHLVVSLLAFNAGVEVGQLCVLALLLPVLSAVKRWVLTGRVGLIVMSALIGHTAWHWMIERAEDVARYPWPRPTPATLATLAWWVVAVVAAAALFKWLGDRIRRGGRTGAAPVAPLALPGEAAD